MIIIHTFSFISSCFRNIQGYYSLRMNERASGVFPVIGLHRETYQPTCINRPTFLAQSIHQFFAPSMGRGPESQPQGDVFLDLSPQKSDAHLFSPSGMHKWLKSGTIGAIVMLNSPYTFKKCLY